jgi:hypothetical protein
MSVRTQQKTSVFSMIHISDVWHVAFWNKTSRYLSMLTICDRSKLPSNFLASWKIVEDEHLKNHVYWATKKTPASWLHRASQMKRSLPSLKVSIFHYHSLRKVQRGSSTTLPFLASPAAQNPNLVRIKATLITCILKKESSKSELPIKSYWILTEKSQNFPTVHL